MQVIENVYAVRRIWLKIVNDLNIFTDDSCKCKPLCLLKTSNVYEDKKKTCRHTTVKYCKAATQLPAAVSKRALIVYEWAIA